MGCGAIFEIDLFGSLFAGGTLVFLSADIVFCLAVGRDRPRAHFSSARLVLRRMGRHQHGDHSIEWEGFSISRQAAASTIWLKESVTRSADFGRRFLIRHDRGGKDRNEADF